MSDNDGSEEKKTEEGEDAEEKEGNTATGLRTEGEESDTSDEGAYTIELNANEIVKVCEWRFYDDRYQFLCKLANEGTAWIDSSALQELPWLVETYVRGIVFFSNNPISAIEPMLCLLVEEFDFDIADIMSSVAEERLEYDNITFIPTNRQGLLPQQKEEHAGRLTAVIDLDETLLRTFFQEISDADYTVDAFIDGQPTKIWVKKRPFVDEFIERISELFEVVVFTAALSSYADPIIDALPFGHTVNHRLYRGSCLQIYGRYVKDLSRLGRPLEKMLIIDDNPDCYTFQQHLAIEIAPWRGDNHDISLFEILNLLERIAHRHRMQETGLNHAEHDDDSDESIEEDTETNQNILTDEKIESPNASSVDSHERARFKVLKIEDIPEEDEPIEECENLSNLPLDLSFRKEQQLSTDDDEFNELPADHGKIIDIVDWRVIEGRLQFGCTCKDLGTLWLPSDYLTSHVPKVVKFVRMRLFYSNDPRVFINDTIERVLARDFMVDINRCILESEKEKMELRKMASKPVEPLFAFIPPKDSNDVDKLTVVLDLDGTLVSSTTSLEAADYRVKTDVDGEMVRVGVRKRPFVDEFLSRCGQLFEVVLFTASMQSYADPVVDELDRDGVIRYRLYRPDTTRIHRHYIKDLSRLGRPLVNTFIVDDLESSCILHVDNAIKILPWRGDPHDRELLRVLDVLENLNAARSNPASDSSDTYSGLEATGTTPYNTIFRTISTLHPPQER